MALPDQPDKVTVAIATFNSGAYLIEAVHSILDQTHRDLEIIVVDDGSTDGSVDQLEADVSDPRMVVLRQENSGKSVALNQAIAQATGGYVAIQDGDDIAHPRRIERLVTAMRRRPELGAVFSRHDLIVDGRTIAPRSLPMSESQCRAVIDALRTPAHDPTGMYRIDVARAFPYDPEARIGQGVDMMLRVGERYPIAVLGECLYSYRVDPGSTTRATPTRASDAIERVRDNARARRGQPLDAQLADRPPRATNSSLHHMVDAVVDLRLQSRWASSVSLALELGRFRPRLIPRLTLAVVTPGAVLRQRRALT